MDSYTLFDQFFYRVSAVSVAAVNAAAVDVAAVNAAAVGSFFLLILHLTTLFICALAL